MKKQKWPQKQAVAGHMEVFWDCPHCGMTNSLNMDHSDIEGGCSGHFNDEYCYCPPREYRKTLPCASCGVDSEVYA